MRALAMLTAAAAAAWAAAQEPAAAGAGEEGLRLFREVVAPTFAAQCAECHDAAQHKGDLILTTREALAAGGENGDPLAGEDPLLLRLIEHREKPFMPRKKPALEPAVIAGIRRWIELGAPYAHPIETEARQWWSFGALRPPAAPPGAGHPIDAFLGAAPPPADRATLIRRLWLDLLGLSPTRAEVAAFVADARPNAWELLVETALASPRYGERWGRHWLDAARYADSAGYEFDVERPNAWPYRDFVIDAVNDDLPWDEFLRWQLAGDELAPGDARAVAATGFLAAGPRVDNQVLEDLRYDELDDMLATTGSAMLGLTVACARCHDHKYDPIPQKDYYSMLAAFTSTEFVDAPLRGQSSAAEVLAAARRSAWRYATAAPPAGWEREGFDDGAWSSGTGGFGAPGTPGAELGTEWHGADIWLRRNFAWKEAPLGLWLHHDEDVEIFLNGEKIFAEAGFLKEYEFVELPAAKPRPNADNLLAVHCRQSVGGQYVDVIPVSREDFERARRHLGSVLAVRDRGPEPAESWLLERGNPGTKKERVTLGFLTAVGDGSRSPADYLAAARAGLQARAQDGAAPRSTGQRAALALWLTDVAHGAGALAARVAVNRIWQHHFGRGLMATAGDFGAQGDPPEHPELLEWLAADFVRRGWSVKEMHRLILTSAAWRQAGAGAGPRRLEGEIVRDRILQTSGCLNLAMGGPAVQPWIHPDAIATGSTKKWPENVVDGPNTWRRSVYVLIRRSVMFPMFEVFDGPTAQQACTRRNLTTTPLQALTLLNDAFVRDQARRFAARLEQEHPGDRSAQVEAAFWDALARAPTAQERAEALEFLARSPLADFCQVLFALDEFVYVD